MDFTEQSELALPKHSIGSLLSLVVSEATSPGTCVEIITPVTFSVPRIPHEIIDQVLEHLSVGLDLNDRSLLSCSLVSKCWLQSCRSHLFRVGFFSPKTMTKWVKAFPVPERSPAHHVRSLRFWLREVHDAPEEFSKHTPWFTNAKEMLVYGDGRLPSLRTFLSWELPRSVTSLEMQVWVNLGQLQGLMGMLHNMDDFQLSGCIFETDEGTMPGPQGTALRGGFCGKLRLIDKCANEDVMNMLLGSPTGLHFTEMQVHPRRECLVSTVRLAEACGETLARLRYSVAFYDGSEPFRQSFDFSKFPNLQEVTFQVNWVQGNLHWIPIALSTLKPATSPHSSSIYLGFDYPADRLLTHGTPGTTELEELRRNLGWIADELTRIQREYGGAVKFIVFQGPDFRRLAAAPFNALERWSS